MTTHVSTTNPVRSDLRDSRPVAGATVRPSPIAAGQSSDAIARELFVSSKTVRNTVSSIYAKPHAPDRAAIIKAREAGLVRA